MLARNPISDAFYGLALAVNQRLLQLDLTQTLVCATAGATAIGELLAVITTCPKPRPQHNQQFGGSGSGQGTFRSSLLFGTKIR